MVSLAGDVFLNGNSNGLSEKCSCLSSSGGASTKYKIRRVSAVRDFPPGCGRNAQRISLLSEEREGDLVENKSKVNVMEFSGTSMESRFVEADGSSSGKGTDGSLGESVNKLVDTNGLIDGELNSETKSLVVEQNKILENGGMKLSNVLPEKEHLVLLESGEVHLLGLGRSENGNEKRIVIEKGTFADDADSGDRVKSISPSKWICDPPDVIVKQASKMKDNCLRRRISAIRNFPPFCGRNSPGPTEDDRMKIQGHGRFQFKSGKENKKIAGITTISDAKVMSEETLRFRAVDKSTSEVGKGIIEKCGEDAQGGDSEKFGLSHIVTELRGSLTVPDKENTRQTSSLGANAKQKKKILKRSPLDDVDDLDDVIERAAKRRGFDGPAHPLRLGKGRLSSLDDGAIERKIRRHGFSRQHESDLVRRGQEFKADDSTGTIAKVKSICAVKAANRGEYAIVARNDKDHVHNRKHPENFLVGQTSNDFYARQSPGHLSSSDIARNKVMETLNLFRSICTKLLNGKEEQLVDGEEQKTKDGRRRVDLFAAKIIKKEGKEVNTGKQIIGAVPGVEIGDRFHYRVELAIIGVHRLYQAGIDYIKYGGKVIAASIVSSGAYADDTHNADVLIYSGEGGNVVGKNTQPEDQKLERGNLALKNSIDVRNPVRVIRGSKETKASSSARAKQAMTYVYDGLYTVERFWNETGTHDSLKWICNSFGMLSPNLSATNASICIATKATPVVAKLFQRNGGKALIQETGAETREFSPVCVVGAL